MCIWKLVTDSALSFILKWNNNKTRKKLYENKSENKYRYTLKWRRGGGGGGSKNKEKAFYVNCTLVSVTTVVVPKSEKIN